MRVVLREVDGFGGVGVGLGPVLADFVRHPCAELKLAVADGLRHLEHELGALFPTGAAPRLERLLCRFHCRLDVLFTGFLEDANNLAGIRRIERLDLVGRLDALAADDQFVLASELCADFVQRSFHLLRILRPAEIDHRLVFERCCVLCADLGRGFYSCHLLDLGPQALRCPGPNTQFYTVNAAQAAACL